MVRRWFSIAGALAIAGVMLATDVSQAGPLQRLRDRLRGRYSDDEGAPSSRFGFRRAYYRNGEPAEMVVEGSQGTRTAVASNQVALDIRVPANAQVWVNDTKIKQTGSMRTFTAPDLTAGQIYSYKIKAEWTPQGGSKETRERKVEVRPGERKMVDFTRRSNAPEELKQPKQSRENDEKE